MYRFKHVSQEQATEHELSIVLVKAAEVLLRDGLLTREEFGEIHRFLVVAQPGDLLRRADKYFVEMV